MRKLLWLFAGVFIVMPIAAFAVDINNNPIGSLNDTTPVGSRSTIITEDYNPDTLATQIITLVNWFSWFIGVIAVVMGLYAGYLFITGGGEPAQLQTARKTLLWAIIGIAVAILAFAIIAITKALLNINQ